MRQPPAAPAGHNHSMTTVERFGTAAASRTELLAHALAAGGGLVFAWMLRQFPFADAVAPFSWSLVATGIVATCLLLKRVQRVWLPAAVLLMGYGLPALWSLAAGSSLAALTWLPLMAAALLLSSLSPAFLLAATAGLAFHYTGALAVLKNDINARATSGSVTYFLGFAGAAGTLLWTRLAGVVVGRFRYWQAASLLAVVLAADLAWLALASGARAAVFGLVAAVIVYVGREFLLRRSAPEVFRNSMVALLAVIILVPAVDVGVTKFYTPHVNSTMWPVLIQRSEATQRELESGRSSGSMRTRLQFWRQAGLALLARPQGHGPASYTFVNHEYQDRPMVWSGSPHNFLALAAVEGGFVSMAAWLFVLALALWRALKHSSAAAALLAAGVVVMSFDVFSSQPVQNLFWLSIIGFALGTKSGEPDTSVSLPLVPIGSVALSGTVIVGIAAALLFYIPCGDRCDSVVRYRGHPGSNSSVLSALDNAPADDRWDAFKSHYPLWFGLEQRRANAWLQAGDSTAYLKLIRHYPYQSVDNYLLFTEHTEDQKMAALVAGCGLEAFFDGSIIWRDNRSSAAELEDARKNLSRIVLEEEPGRRACQQLGVRFFN